MIISIRYESATEPHYMDWEFDTKNDVIKTFKAPDGATIIVTRKVRQISRPYACAICGVTLSENERCRSKDGRNLCLYHFDNEQRENREEFDKEIAIDEH